MKETPKGYELVCMGCGHTCYRPKDLTAMDIAEVMELVFGEQIDEEFGNDLHEFAARIIKKAQTKGKK